MYVWLSQFISVAACDSQVVVVVVAQMVQLTHSHLASGEVLMAGLDVAGLICVDQPDLWPLGRCIKILKMMVLKMSLSRYRLLKCVMETWKYELCMLLYNLEFAYFHIIHWNQSGSFAVSCCQQPVSNFGLLLFGCDDDSLAST